MLELYMGEKKPVLVVAVVVRKSGGRISKQGKSPIRDGKSGQSTGDKKQCSRCGLTDYTQGNCRHKGAE